MADEDDIVGGMTKATRDTHSAKDAKPTSSIRSLKIRTKLVIVLVLVAAVSVGIYSIVEYRAAKRALLEESFDTLVAVRELKAKS